MWRSYFYNLQIKYSMRLSKTKPLVIRLDGKAVTRNKEIDLIDRENESSFSNALEKTVRYFTDKYNCYSIFGSDEVSFIFPNPQIVVKDLDSDENYHSNEVICMFAQYFYDYFNEFDKHKKVYWHGKCFSISEEKIRSYVLFRSKIIKNVMSTYFLVKNNGYRGNEKLESRMEKCKKYSDYKKFEDMADGILYYNGNRINLEKFLKDEEVELINKNDIDNAFSDLM